MGPIPADHISLKEAVANVAMRIPKPESAPKIVATALGRGELHLLYMGSNNRICGLSGEPWRSAGPESREWLMDLFSSDGRITTKHPGFSWPDEAEGATPFVNVDRFNTWADSRFGAYATSPPSRTIMVPHKRARTVELSPGNPIELYRDANGQLVEAHPPRQLGAAVKGPGTQGIHSPEPTFAKPEEDIDPYRVGEFAGTERAGRPGATPAIERIASERIRLGVALKGRPKEAKEIHRFYCQLQAKGWPPAAYSTVYDRLGTIRKNKSEDL